MLNLEEMQLIADLSKNPGYQLLLSTLETSSTGLTEALEKTNLGPQSDEILIQWRIIRRVLKVLKEAPENIKLLLEDELRANPALKMRLPMDVPPSAVN